MLTRNDLCMQCILRQNNKINIHVTLLYPGSHMFSQTEAKHTREKCHDSCKDTWTVASFAVRAALQFHLKGLVWILIVMLITRVTMDDLRNTPTLPVCVLQDAILPSTQSTRGGGEPSCSSPSPSQFSRRCQSGGLALWFCSASADSGKWLKGESIWQQICVDIIKLSSWTGSKALNCLLTQLLWLFSHQHFKWARYQSPPPPHPPSPATLGKHPLHDRDKIMDTHAWVSSYCINKCKAI